MKIILTHILCFLTWILTQTLYSQTVNTNASTNVAEIEPPLCGELCDASSLPSVETFFNQSWLQADIWLTDGGIIRDKKIKYNMLLDELFWLEPNSNQTVKLDKEAINKFHIQNFQGDTAVIFGKIKVRKFGFTDSVEIFAQEINYKNLALFIHHSIIFTGKEETHLGKQLTLKDIYKKVPIYYLSYSNNKLVEIKRFGRRELYFSFPEKKYQIRDYFKNSVSGRIRTYHEVISFITFLSSIMD